MFTSRYFPGRFFPRRYFPAVGGLTVSEAWVPDGVHFAGWTQVVDAETGVGVAGARVFLNGKAYGPADEFGRLWVVGTWGSCTVRIVKGGLYNERWDLVVTTAFPARLDVTRVQRHERPLTLACTPQPGIALAFAQADGTVLEQLLTDDQGRAVTTQTYDPGAYTVTASKTDYTAVETDITVRSGVYEYAVAGPILIGNGSQEGL